MRAIGAADGAVAQVFIVEGIVIGVISWLLGSLCAVPLSGLLSDAVGMSLLQSPLATRSRWRASGSGSSSW